MTKALRKAAQISKQDAKEIKAQQRRAGTVHAAPSRPEQAARSHSRRCPACRRPFALEDRETTEQLLGISEHPLVAHMRLHQQEGDHGGPPPLTDRFLDLLDHSPSQAAARRQAALDIAELLVARYPTLAAVLCASLLVGNSNRQLAEELGISHHTVETMLAHGRRTLQIISAEYPQHPS